MSTPPSQDFSFWYDFAFFFMRFDGFTFLLLMLSAAAAAAAAAEVLLALLAAAS